MSFQQLVLERLSAIEQAIADIQNNAKTTEEFDEQSTLDPTSKIRVSLNGTSQWIDIQKLFDGILGLNFGNWKWIEGSFVEKGVTNNVPNTDLNALEPNDKVFFKIISNGGEPFFLMGHTYLTGDKQLIASYDLQTPFAM